VFDPRIRREIYTGVSRSSLRLAYSPYQGVGLVIICIKQKMTIPPEYTKYQPRNTNIKQKPNNRKSVKIGE